VIVGSKQLLLTTALASSLFFSTENAEGKWIENENDYGIWNLDRVSLILPIKLSGSFAHPFGCIFEEQKISAKDKFYVSVTIVGESASADVLYKTPCTEGMTSEDADTLVYRLSQTISEYLASDKTHLILK